MMRQETRRNNNYDLLRLIFALNVFFVHAAVLSGSTSLLFLESVFNSKVAVAGFFVISGFFVFMSYERTKNLKVYIVKRMRRILPAYYAIILFFAFLSVFFSTLPVQKYFSEDFVRYLIANIFFLNFLHPQLPGVFTHNPVMAVNGVSWAVRTEILFYMLVPVIVYLMGISHRMLMLSAIYLISVLASYYLQYLEATTSIQIFHFMRVELTMQMTYFVSGAMLYYYFDFFSKHQATLVAAAIAVVIINSYFMVAVLEPLAFSMIVIYLGSCFKPLANFAKLGDMSYGIFLLHFPILQILISFGIIKELPFLGLLTAILFILSGSFLFWNMVERPFLYKESYYISMSR